MEKIGEISAVDSRAESDSLVSDEELEQEYKNVIFVEEDFFDEQDRISRSYR